jgi:hypothetical protein
MERRIEDGTEKDGNIDEITKRVGKGRKEKKQDEEKQHKETKV